MASDLLEHSLGALSRHREGEDDEARARVLRDAQRRLLARPEVAADLVQRLAAGPPDADAADDAAADAADDAADDADADAFDDALALLGGALDEARMARENGLGEGQALLDAVAAALDAVAARGELDATARFLLAQAHVRAGLTPPAAVMLTPGEELELPGGVPKDEVPDLAGLIAAVRAEVGGDPLQLHAGLAEMLAMLPAEVRALALSEIASQPAANVERLGAYWLLDPAPEIRDAIAGFILGRAKAGRLGAIERTRLVTVRKWLPGGEARALVDAALRESLRRPAEATAAAKPWKIHRAVASLPDGVGAQSLAVAAQQGQRRVVGVVLLKAGHGVKDAFLVACDSAAEHKRFIAQIVEEADAVDVTADFVVAALGRALTDAAGAEPLPAPGLVDVAEILPEPPLPRPGDAAAIVAELDADGTLQALTPQKRGRLVNESEHWFSTYAVVGSWFEDSDVVRDVLARARTAEGRRRALWRHVATRRDWWASIFARAAATLAASNDARDAAVWTSFAVTAQALVDGRQLKKTPIMEQIVEGSLAAFAFRKEAGEDPWDDEDDDEEGYDGSVDVYDASPPPLDVEFTEPEPERPGELDALLAPAHRTATWLEGYVMAAAVAPTMLRPTAWLPELLTTAALTDRATLQRTLDLLIARANAAAFAAADAATATAGLAPLSPAARTEWARGFDDFVERFPQAWPNGKLRRDDRKMLALLADADPATFDDGLVKLLGTWLAERFARRG